MGDYCHILLAADFSDHGDAVAQKARSLAESHRAKLSAVHILDDIPMPDTGYGTILPLTEATGYELLEREKAKLRRLGASLKIEVPDLWLVWGQPKQEIVLLAERLKVDLIVVGSHGRHGWSLLLGSTANAVLHHAGCDVMAVRLPESP